MAKRVWLAEPTNVGEEPRSGVRVNDCAARVVAPGPNRPRNAWEMILPNMPDENVIEHQARRVSLNV